MTFLDEKIATHIGNIVMKDLNIHLNEISIELKKQTALLEAMARAIQEWHNDDSHYHETTFDKLDRLDKPVPKYPMVEAGSGIKKPEKITKEQIGEEMGKFANAMKTII